MAFVGSALTSSTGEMGLTASLTAKGLLSSYGVGNATTINAKITSAENHNYLLYGPITINTGAGVSLTVAANANIRIKDFADVS